jgi:hypothetical protein
MESLAKIKKKAIVKENHKKINREIKTKKWFKQLCASIGKNKNEENDQWTEIMNNLTKEIKKHPKDYKHILCYIGSNETTLELSNLYPYSYDPFNIKSEKMFNDIYDGICHLENHQKKRPIKRKNIFDTCYIFVSAKNIDDEKIIILEIAFADELCTIF